jgi:hypothetical protein
MALFDGGDMDWLKNAFLNPGAPSNPLVPTDPAPAMPQANGPNGFADQLRYNLTGSTEKNADLGKGISQGVQGFTKGVFQPPPSPKQQAGATTPAQQHQLAGANMIGNFSNVTNGKQSPFAAAAPGASIDPSVDPTTGKRRGIYQV